MKMIALWKKQNLTLLQILYKIGGKMRKKSSPICSLGAFKLMLQEEEEREKKMHRKLHLMKGYLKQSQKERERGNFTIVVPLFSMQHWKVGRVDARALVLLFFLSLSIWAELSQFHFHSLSTRRELWQIEAPLGALSLRPRRPPSFQ